MLGALVLGVVSSGLLLACPPSVGELCDYGACDAAPDARRSDGGDASREASSADAARE